MNPLDTIRKKTADLLADVEAELAQADRVDDRIGEHARTWERKATAELAKRGKTLGAAGNDPDEEARYLHLLAQRRRCVDVDTLAQEAKRRR
jgi:hypothetical protein